MSTNRITGFARKVIRPILTAFLLSRHILGVVLHETICELHSKKMDVVLFKIDFEKATIEVTLLAISIAYESICTKVVQMHSLFKEVVWALGLINFTL